MADPPAHASPPDQNPPPVPIAVAGLGRRGLHLVDRFREHPGFRLTAVCDPDGAARAKCGGSGVPAVADLAGLPADTAAVAVAVPAVEQRSAAGAVLAAGRACVLHPPLGFGPDGWAEMTAAAAEAGRPLVVLRPGRWEMSFRTAATSAGSGEAIAAITRTGWAALTVPPPADVAAAARNRLEDWLDELVALCGGCGEPAVLSAVRRDGEDHGGWAVTVRFGEDGPVAALDLLRGAAVSLDTGWLTSGAAGGSDGAEVWGREPDGELFLRPAAPRLGEDGADDWPDALHCTLAADAPWAVTDGQTATVLWLLGEIS